MLDVILVIFEVEGNKGVGINPTVFRHNGALEHQWLPHVVRRSPVMREYRAADG
jgi:hypothetical protein